MNHSKRYGIYFVTCLFVLLLLPLGSAAQEKLPDPKTYAFTWSELLKHKRYFDDPRPWMKEWPLKKAVPAEVYKAVVFDIPEMKTVWADTVGFKAPDVVGKLRPEIKPGKYTYKDVQNNPAFKELMYPDLYNRIKPGGPPFVGNIPEFEIIPTRQYYWSLATGEATRKNMGKTKQDEKGYIVPASWQGGFPFPRPSGPFKAQQIIYNNLNPYNGTRYDYSSVHYGYNQGFDRNLKQDMDNKYLSTVLRLAGRVLIPPYGFYDDEARNRGEASLLGLIMESPRDIAGLTVLTSFYMDPKQTDASLMYLPSMRRVRKMSATDTQDPISGQDLIYDDQGGFSQKLSATVYPYKYEVIEEREYLVPAPSIDGAEYIASKGLEYRNVRMERRPIYVVKMTQLDPNYVYSKRIFYVDRETLLFYQVENYDRKGRLYRVSCLNWGFDTEAGSFSWAGYFFAKDAVDMHSMCHLSFVFPAMYSRQDMLNSLTRGYK